MPASLKPARADHLESAIPQNFYRVKVDEA